MTILVIHERYRVRGGEDGVFETECRLLEEAGHRVVKYEKSNHDIPDKGGKIGLALRTIWNPSTVREVRALIRREKPDVVHCHNTFPLISPSIYWAASREGVPVVQTLHNYRLVCLDGYLFRNGRICERCLGRTPLSGVCRRCYRGSFATSATLAAMIIVHRVLGTWRHKVTRYIALTSFARDKFIAAGLPAEKIVVKPNAFAETTPQEQPSSDSSSARHSATGIVYLGRISPEKGVDVLLRAIAHLKESDGPTPDCAIIGDGPERESLERLADDLGITGQVHFLGPLSREKALGKLATANLLVFPSLWYEQFAVTPLEAMALGVPVLASDIASTGTIVENDVSGRLFRAGDPTALAAALRSLLADPAALRRMGLAARAAFEASDCRPDRNLARLIAIYASTRI